MSFFIRSEKAKLERYAPATAQRNINLKFLEELAIPLPPLEEQREIVRETEARLKAAEELTSRLNDQLRRANIMRKSLLREAFAGDLEPQNPADEPASNLLKRIQAAREAEIEKSKVKRSAAKPRGKPVEDEGSRMSDNVLPVSPGLSSSRPRQVRLIRLRLYENFSSLKAAEFRLRSSVGKSERLSPLCLVGLNGSGKSNLIEALSEIFCHAELSLLPWKSITGKQRTIELHFELEYQLLASPTGKPTTVRLEKPSNQPVAFKIVQHGNEEIVTDPAQCLSLLPTRILGYSSGLNETISIPYFRTAAIYSQEVLKQAQREKASPSQKLPDVPDSRTFFLDYECNALILISNYLLQSNRRLGLFRKNLRIDSLNAFDIRYRGKYQGNKPVALTRELAGYLEALRSCANSVETVGDSEVFHFTNPNAAAANLKLAFKTAERFFRALYKLSLLNPLALTGKKRRFFLREEAKAGQLERPPTISREDRIFSVENIRVNLTTPRRSIDYAAISDGGQRVCPFCGLNYYADRDGGARSGYDHFLPRVYYPLAAVNFHNLVPMCDDCNERPRKGTKDVLFSDDGRKARRKFYYPYSKPGGIALSVECIVPPKPKNTWGAWKVKAKAVKPGETALVLGWNSVFDVETRYAARVKEGLEGWMKDFLNSKRYPDQPTVAQLRNDLASKAAWLSKPEQLKSRAEAALQAAAFTFMARDAQDNMLTGYAAMATSEAITGIPTALG